MALPSPLDPMAKIQIVTLGELLIDLIPGEIGLPLQEVRTFIPKPGGAPANVAVAASRLGANAAFIGKVGQDHFGTFLADVLRREGVDTRGLRFDEQARTTLAVVALPAVDRAEFIFYRNPGADQRLLPEELDQELLRACNVFHFGTVSLTDEPSRSSSRLALAAARKAGAIISCDVNYRPALWQEPGSAAAVVEEVLPEVDLVKVNEAEAAHLTGVGDLDPRRLDLLEDAARKLLDQGPDLAVITLGKNGSYFQTRAGGELVPGFAVDAVDSVGCGDAFVAGLLVNFCSGQAWGDLLDISYLRDCVEFANAVGALTALKPGAIPAMPGIAAVRAFLGSHPARVS